MKIHHAIAKLFGYELINIKKHHPTLESHLKALLTQLDIDSVIDVGANNGQYGIMLRKLGFKGEIHSFEPVTISFNRLQKEAEKDKKWHIYHCALGHENTSISINISQASEFASLLPATSYAKKIYDKKIPLSETEQIQVKTLDDIFGQNKCFLEKRIFLKMDTQGYDLNVIKGGKLVVEQALALQSEISIIPLYKGMPDYLESLAVFNKSGFKLSGIYPVSRDPNNSILIELDCIMRKQ